MDDNDDTDKSVIDKLMEVVTTGVSGMAKAALTTAQKTNGQLLAGDAAIKPEAIPASTAKAARKKRAAAPYRANKRVAAARARNSKAPAVETAPKKTVKKAVQKGAAKKSAPKKTASKTAKQSKSTKPPKNTAKSRAKKTAGEKACSEDVWQEVRN